LHFIISAVAYDVELSLDEQGFAFFRGIIWYRHDVKLPPAAKTAKALKLWFGGPDAATQVWVNGRDLGVHNVSNFGPLNRVEASGSQGMDMSGLSISATKPAAKPAAMLRRAGITIVPVKDDEGNVDRYILSRRLAIERRAGPALLRGIMDKTLFTSAIYLREHFRIAVLIVEGEVDYSHTRFDPQAIRGALSSMILLYGQNVLCTPNVEETVALIALMARQEQVGIPEISLIPKRKATDLPDLQRRVVEMLPGCGRVLARDLLQHFGGVEQIVCAGEQALRDVPGVGANKATMIRKVLHAEYEAVDTERNIEDAIEAAPELLFKQPVTLLARQHHIYSEAEERHVVDMVFFDAAANELVLVELKRGPITAAHGKQIRRYLDHAHDSALLRPLLAKGAAARGLLATVEEARFQPPDRDVSVRIVNKKKVIAVLKRLRERRLMALASARALGHTSAE